MTLMADFVKKIRRIKHWRQLECDHVNVGKEI